MLHPDRVNSPAVASALAALGVAQRRHQARSPLDGDFALRCQQDRRQLNGPQKE